MIRAAPHAENTLFLLITKHPVFFLSSLHNRPENPLWNHEEMEFNQIIETPWPVSERDNVGDKTLDSPIHLWNEKMRAYVALMGAADNVIHIHYEDLLSDFEDTLNRVAEYIPAINAGYGNVRRSNKASDNLRFEDYVRRYKYQKIKADYKNAI